MYMSEHSEFSPMISEINNVISEMNNVISEMNSTNHPIPCNDTIVQSVVSSFLERSRLGQLKYGTNLDRTDLTTLEWIQHAQEELMDGILYLEKLKQAFTKT